MPRMNRGETTKLSIKLSAAANEKILRIKENLNLSKAGVILFALSNVFRDLPIPAKEHLLNLETKIDLEPDNFPVTVKREFSKMVDHLAAENDMKKNVLVGLLVSNYFEQLDNEKLLADHQDTEPQQITVQANEDLKKKIVEYAENTYIPLSGLVSLALIEGPFEGIPSFQNSQTDLIFTTIPSYLYKEIKRQADKKEIREHFYITLCLYKAFYSNDKIFD